MQSKIATAEGRNTNLLIDKGNYVYSSNGKMPALHVEGTGIVTQILQFFIYQLKLSMQVCGVNGEKIWLSSYELAISNC